MINYKYIGKSNIKKENAEENLKREIRENIIK